MLLYSKIQRIVRHNMETKMDKVQQLHAWGLDEWKQKYF